MPFYYCLDKIRIISKEVCYYIIPKDAILGWDISAGTSASPVDQGVICRIRIKLIHDNYSLADFYISFLFKIKDFENCIKLKKDGNYKIPIVFNRMIKMASLGTSRGIIFSEIRSVFDSDILLPLITLENIKNSEKRTTK